MLIRPMLMRGAVVQGAATTWNPNDKNGGITLSNNNATATGSPTDTPRSVRATSGRGSGKLYFEILPNANNTPGSGTETGVLIGVGNINSVLGNSPEYPGFDANSVGYQSATGSIFFNRNNVRNAGAYTTEVVGIALDLDVRQIWFSRNGVFSGNPVAGTDGVSLPSGALFPITGLYNAAIATLRTNGGAFSSSPPSGFSPWG